MATTQEIDLVFERQDEGSYNVYAPDLPGLHTQGDDLDDAMANAARRRPFMPRDSAKLAKRSTAA